MAAPHPDAYKALLYCGPVNAPVCFKVDFSVVQPGAYTRFKAKCRRAAAAHGCNYGRDEMHLFLEDRTLVDANVFFSLRDMCPQRDACRMFMLAAPDAPMHVRTESTVLSAAPHKQVLLAQKYTNPRDAIPELIDNSIQALTQRPDLNEDNFVVDVYYYDGGTAANSMLVIRDEGVGVSSKTSKTGRNAFEEALAFYKPKVERHTAEETKIDDPRSATGNLGKYGAGAKLAVFSLGLEATTTTKVAGDDQVTEIVMSHATFDATEECGHDWWKLIPVRRKWGSKRIHFRDAKEWSTEAAAADDLKWKTALKRVIQKKPDGANELLDALTAKESREGSFYQVAVYGLHPHVYKALGDNPQRLAFDLGVDYFPYVDPQGAGGRLSPERGGSTVHWPALTINVHKRGAGGSFDATASDGAGYMRGLMDSKKPQLELDVWFEATFGHDADGKLNAVEAHGRAVSTYHRVEYGALTLPDPRPFLIRESSGVAPTDAFDDACRAVDGSQLIVYASGRRVRKAQVRDADLPFKGGVWDKSANTANPVGHAVTVLFLDDKPKLKETKLEFYGDVLQPFNVQCFEVKPVGLAWPPGAARLASAGARHKEITVTKFNQWVMNKRRTCDRSTEFRRVLSIASADPVLQRHCYELERAKAVIKKFTDKPKQLPKLSPRKVLNNCQFYETLNRTHKGQTDTFRVGDVVVVPIKSKNQARTTVHVQARVIAFVRDCKKLSRDEKSKDSAQGVGWVLVQLLPHERFPRGIVIAELNTTSLCKFQKDMHPTLYGVLPQMTLKVNDRSDHTAKATEPLHNTAEEAEPTPQLPCLSQCSSQEVGDVLEIRTWVKDIESETQPETLHKVAGYKAVPLRIITIVWRTKPGNPHDKEMEYIATWAGGDRVSTAKGSNSFVCMIGERKSDKLLPQGTYVVETRLCYVDEFVGVRGHPEFAQLEAARKTEFEQRREALLNELDDNQVVQDLLARDDRRLCQLRSVSVKFKLTPGPYHSFEVELPNAYLRAAGAGDMVFLWAKDVSLKQYTSFPACAAGEDEDAPCITLVNASDDLQVDPPYTTVLTGEVTPQDAVKGDLAVKRVLIQQQLQCLPPQAHGHVLDQWAGTLRIEYGAEHQEVPDVWVLPPHPDDLCVMQWHPVSPEHDEAGDDEDVDMVREAPRSSSVGAGARAGGGSGAYPAYSSVGKLELVNGAAVSVTLRQLHAGVMVAPAWGEADRDAASEYAVWCRLEVQSPDNASLRCLGGNDNAAVQVRVADDGSIDFPNLHINVAPCTEATCVTIAARVTQQSWVKGVPDFDKVLKTMRVTVHPSRKPKRVAFVVTTAAGDTKEIPQADSKAVLQRAAGSPLGDVAVQVRDEANRNVPDHAIRAAILKVNGQKRSSVAAAMSGFDEAHFPVTPKEIGGQLHFKVRCGDAHASLVVNATPGPVARWELVCDTPDTEDDRVLIPVQVGNRSWSKGLAVRRLDVFNNVIEDKPDRRLTLWLGEDKKYGSAELAGQGPRLTGRRASEAPLGKEDECQSVPLFVCVEGDPDSLYPLMASVGDPAAPNLRSSGRRRHTAPPQLRSMRVAARFAAGDPRCLAVHNSSDEDGMATQMHKPMPHPVQVVLSDVSGNRCSNANADMAVSCDACDVQHGVAFDETTCAFAVTELAHASTGDHIVTFRVGKHSCTLNMRVEENEDMAAVVDALTTALPQPPTPVTAGSCTLLVDVQYGNTEPLDDERMRSLVESTSFVLQRSGERNLRALTANITNIDRERSTVTVRLACGSGEEAKCPCDVCSTLRRAGSYIIHTSLERSFETGGRTVELPELRSVLSDVVVAPGPPTTLQLANPSALARPTNREPTVCHATTVQITDAYGNAIHNPSRDLQLHMRLECTSSPEEAPHLTAGKTAKSVIAENVSQNGTVTVKRLSVAAIDTLRAGDYRFVMELKQGDTPVAVTPVTHDFHFRSNAVSQAALNLSASGATTSSAKVKMLRRKLDSCREKISDVSARIRDALSPTPRAVGGGRGRGRAAHNSVGHRMAYHGNGAGAGAGAGAGPTSGSGAEEPVLREEVQAALGEADHQLRDLRARHRDAPLAHDGQGRLLRVSHNSAPSGEVYGPLHHIVAAHDPCVARLLAWDFGGNMNCVFTRHVRDSHRRNFHEFMSDERVHNRQQLRPRPVWMQNVVPSARYVHELIRVRPEHQELLTGSIAAVIQLHTIVVDSMAHANLLRDAFRQPRRGRPPKILTRDGFRVLSSGKEGRAHTLPSGFRGHLQSPLKLIPDVERSQEAVDLKKRIDALKKALEDCKQLEKLVNKRGVTAKEMQELAKREAFWKLVNAGVRAAEDGTSAHRQKRKRRGGTDTIQAAIDSIEGVSDADASSYGLTAERKALLLQCLRDTGSDDAGATAGSGAPTPPPARHKRRRRASSDGR